MSKIKTELNLKYKRKDNKIVKESQRPLKIDYDKESIESIIKKIEFAIEQHPSFLKVIPEEELFKLEKLNKEREW